MKRKKRRGQAQTAAYTETDRTYDKTAKAVLGNRQMLAPVVQRVVSEFHDISLEEIQDHCIDGEPQISAVPVTFDRSRTRSVAEKRFWYRTVGRDERKGERDVQFEPRIESRRKRRRSCRGTARHDFAVAERRQGDRHHGSGDWLDDRARDGFLEVAESPASTMRFRCSDHFVSSGFLQSQEAFSFAKILLHMRLSFPHNIRYRD